MEKGQGKEGMALDSHSEQSQDTYHPLVSHLTDAVLNKLMGGS